MTRAGAAGVAVAGVVAGTVLAGAGVSWWSHRSQPAPARPAPPPVAAPPAPHATITLFDPSDDGQDLTPVEQEIPAGSSPEDQARLVVEAAIERGALPDVGLWPPGTALRTYFSGTSGETVVDLAGLSTRGLGGGSTTERLAVSALLRAIAVNVPHVTSVRLLVDGQDPSAFGHLDARRGFAADRQGLRPAPIPR